MDHNISIPELVQSCRHDNRQAQSRLYERLQGKMNGIAIRYVRDRGEAETIMIQGFYKAFTKLEQLDDDSKFEPWLKKIIVNEAIGYIRKNKKYNLTIDIEPYHNVKEDALGHQNLIEEDLLRMIRSLPDGYRSVFNMYALDGYSHKEISARLGIPVNTSKSKLFRARNMLQDMLNKNELINSKNKSHGK